MSDILIIDDDAPIAELLAAAMTKMGNQTHWADSAQQGLTEVQSGRFDVVLLDVRLPDGDGLHILPQIRETANPPEVIIITGHGDPDAAELAIKSGAWDYLVKPASLDNIMLTVRRALAYRREKCAGPRTKVLKRDDIVGNSPCLNATLERVAQAASVESNALICGETGTGKELLARAIHENSARAEHPFVVVDCAALPESLVESVLFGHSKGAFTGAEKQRQGLVCQAGGGTLFLDEVGELPLAIQKAFLRVIQERRFRPVSGHKEVQVNFRLIAATNRDLERMVKQGHFRSDLLFRLRSLSIDASPLRHRKGDLKQLTVYYINRLGDIYGAPVKGLSNEFIEALHHYHWPGNVRELFHTLEEALALAGNEPVLYPHHLPTRIRAILTRMTVKACAPPPAKRSSVYDLSILNKNDFLDIATYRNQMERRYLKRLTQLTNGNRKEACKISGLSRTRLFELLKKHHLMQKLPRDKTASDAIAHA